MRTDTKKPLKLVLVFSFTVFMALISSGFLVCIIIMIRWWEGLEPIGSIEVLAPYFKHYFIMNLGVFFFLSLKSLVKILKDKGDWQRGAFTAKEMYKKKDDDTN